jgi:DNA-3-methyladenine glycosylase I
MTEPYRCPWAGNDPLYLRYHDVEWGVPTHDDRKLLEFLVLEGAQAGLSWLTILRKRENYRLALDGFDPVKIAGYDESKINALLTNPGIIRNRRKVEAAVRNARAFLAIVTQYGSFDRYIWEFVDGTPKLNHWRSMSEVPVDTPESRAMSKALSQQGFKFVGPTICYSFMQAVGMVNDHLADCFRHSEIGLNKDGRNHSCRNTI